MFNKYWLLLGILPLAGCVTETRQETMTLSAPSVSAPNTERPAASSADPYGLQAALATVRQQPWCYRKAHR